MLVDDLLRASAKRHPNKVAIVHRNEHLAYSELDRLSDALARWLMQGGVNKGDRVAIFIENSAEYVLSFFAVLKAGAIAVPVDTQVVSRELAFYLEDCSVGLVLTDTRRSAFVEESLRNVVNPPSVMIVDKSSLEKDNRGRGAVDLSAVRCDLEDLASIIYTSGTTGKPKGVMLSHANLVANANSIVEYLHLRPDDRMMVVLPFSHSYGTSLLTTRVKIGGTLVIDNRFAYPNAVLEAMDREEVTGFAGVPSHYAMLLRKSALHKYKLPKLKYVTQAGGSLASSMIQEFTEILPHVKFYVMYGQTEASARLSYLEPDLLGAKLGSIGKAIPGVELDVLDENAEEVSPGETGEIVARGKNVMVGYWDSPEETTAVLRGDRLFTGDLARVDENGFIYIVGRNKDMMKSGGNRISPLEVEEIVCQFTGVSECAAVGIPDELLGEAIKLLVVLDELAAVTEKDIEDFCKENLASYKVPKQIEIVPSLPKTASGKTKRAELRAV